MPSHSTRLLAATAALFAAAAEGLQGTPVVVNTTYGQVMGQRMSFALGEADVFFRIPFAAPPVGGLRFRAPQPPNPWSGVLDVTSNGTAPACPQIDILGQYLYIGQEDCLYLTVVVPRTQAAARAAEEAGGSLPVMQYIFGGAFIVGDEYEFGFYNATNLALSRNVVVVSGNYRVLLEGFFAHPALQAEDPNHSTGNAAMMDQRAAMQWTQANVANFGGDPARVTIFGESAGGFSICYHVSSPASAGLFSAAVMESGSCDSPQFFLDLDTAVTFNREYATGCGCNASLGDALQLACMRVLDVGSLLNCPVPWFPGQRAGEGGSNTGRTLAQHLASVYPPEFLGKGLRLLPALGPLFPWGPVLDKTTVGLLAPPLQRIVAGTFNKVPWIIGTNHNEGSIFVPLLPLIVQNTSFPIASQGDLMAFVRHILQGYNQTLVNQIASQAVSQPAYNASNFPSDGGFALTYVGSDMLTHYFFRAAARRAARAASAHGAPVWLYHFNHTLSWVEAAILGDYHSSELDFVFGNEWPPIIHAFNADDKTMSAAMTCFWTNLAAAGDPNQGPCTPPLSWPGYAQATDQNINFQLPFAVGSGLNSDIVDFWDGVFASTTGAGYWPPQ
jgi:para-nitrobenzyl esterase